MGRWFNHTVLKKDNWVRENADNWIAYRIKLELNKTLQSLGKMMLVLDDDHDGGDILIFFEHIIYLCPLFPFVPSYTPSHTINPPFIHWSHTVGINEYGDVGKIKRRMYHYPNCQDAYINLFCYMNFPRCDPSTT